MLDTLLYYNIICLPNFVFYSSRNGLLISVSEEYKSFDYRRNDIMNSKAFLKDFEFLRKMIKNGPELLKSVKSMQK